MLNVIFCLVSKEVECYSLSKVRKKEIECHSL